MVASLPWVGYGKQMWMKLFQLVAAFAGGSLAIYTGLEGGYSVGIVAIATAWLATLAVTKIADRRASAKSGDHRPLGRS